MDGFHVHIHNHINLPNMANNQDFEAALARIEAALGRISSNQGGLNVQQEDNALSRLTNIADTLDTISPPQQ